MSIHLVLWKQVLILGVAEAGLYALLPIALVLSYRVSRTIAFVHGGIASSTALLYWVLVYDSPFPPGTRPGLPPFVGLLVVVAIGGALGAGYGTAVTRAKVAALPRMTLTVISLGAMMIVIGIFTSTLRVPPESIPPSPFGNGRMMIAGVVLTSLRSTTILIAVGLVAGLAVFLNSSRTGRHLRAISDYMEAGAWCGVKVAWISTGVHTGAGAIAGLAGALIAAQSGPDPFNLIIFLLRGMAVAIVGGLMSLPIALAAALVMAVVQTALVVGVVGPSTTEMPYSIGRQELILAGLIGPNGAGKSTLFDVISGFRPPDSGTVRLFGQDVTNSPAWRRPRAGMSRVFQSTRIIEDLTVADNLLLGAHHQLGSPTLAYLAGLRQAWDTSAVAERAARAIATMLAIEDRWDDRAGTLSFSGRRRIEIGRALLASPRILLLDEPAAGLDPNSQGAMFDLLRRLHSELGMTVLLVEHNVTAVLSVCELVHVLAAGKVLASGTPAEITANETVRANYLGNRLRFTAAATS